MKSEGFEAEGENPIAKNSRTELPDVLKLVGLGNIRRLVQAYRVRRSPSTVRGLRHRTIVSRVKLAWYCTPNSVRDGELQSAFSTRRAMPQVLWNFEKRAAGSGLLASGLNQ